MAGRKNDPNTLMFNIDADSSGVVKAANEAIAAMKKLNDVAKIDLKKVTGKNIESVVKSFSSPIEGISKVTQAFSKKIVEAQNKLLKSLASGVGDKINAAGKEYNNIVNSWADINDKMSKSEFLQEELKKAAEAVRVEEEKRLAIHQKLEKATKKEERSKKRQAKAETALSDFYLSLDPDKQKEAKLMAEQKGLEGKFLKISGMSRISPKRAQELEQIKARLAQIKKELDNTGKSTKKTDGFFKTLWGRIKNISIYRAIRTGLKWITQGFEEGINNFVQYDESANSTMSNINASLQQIRNTMGVSLVSILQTLEPLITTITDSLVNLLDSFNLAMAKLAGKDTYNSAKKNIEDYASTVDSAKGSLADFDKIRSLDTQQTDPTEMFSEEKVADNENRASRFFETVLEGVREVWGIISTVWQEFEELGVWDILIDAFTEVLKIIGNVILAIGKMIKWFADIGALEPILYGLVGAWMAYKVAASLAAVSSAAAWLMAHPITGSIAIAGAIATLAGVISAINSATKSNISKSDGFSTSMVGLANGGFTTANFIATNENGIKEWVGSNGNSTAVVNDTQMSDIMYGAVKAGCYEGIIDALSDSESYNNASGEVGSSATVEVQGDTLFTIINTEARKRGLKFVRI